MVAPAAPPKADLTIQLRYVGDRIQIRPAGYLGADVFDSYRAACGGATYARNERCNYASVDLVGAIVGRLAAAGFKLDADPSVSSAVQAWEARAKADTHAADARAIEIDARLRERGLALFPFQAQGVSWLAPRDRAVLADDQGLGKTIQALTALPANAPVVVVAPAVAKGVWAREAARWRPDLKVTVLDGRGSFRWPVPNEMVVLNYDITAPAPLDQGARTKIDDEIKRLGKLERSDGPRHELVTRAISKLEQQVVDDDAAIAMFAAAPAGLVVIADEFHVCKGSPKKVARSARFKAIADAAFEVGGRVWGLTGTPLLNRPSELWALLSLIRSAMIVFGSYPNFKRLCGGSAGAFGTTWEAGAISSSVGLKLREVLLRRMKVDVLDQLPAKIVEIVDVSLDPGSLVKLDAIQTELEAQGIDFRAALAEAAAGRNGSVAFEQMSRARALLASAKAGAAIEMVNELEEAGEPVLVFSAHRAPIDALAKRDGWAAITGDTPPAERTKIEERFQRGELKGIAATIKAAGVAITLTRGCNEIFIDSEWTPALNLQAEDRQYRIGQTRTLSVRYLRADHAIDARVFELCEVKRAMVARTVDAAAHRDGPLAERQSAVVALGAAKASEDAVQRAIDSEALAERVRIDRTKADSERVRRKATAKSESANRNRGWEIDRAAFDTAPRGAASAAEEWAVVALSTLEGMDGDFAVAQNGVGFSQADTYLGHALAPAARIGQLTDGEWQVALNMLRKYHGQVGQQPE